MTLPIPAFIGATIRAVSRDSAKKWLFVFAGWTVLVLLFTTHAYVFSTASGQPMQWGPVLLWGMSEWYTWAALTPFIVSLIRRYAIDRPTSFKSLTIESAECLGLCDMAPCMLVGDQRFGDLTPQSAVSALEGLR